MPLIEVNRHPTPRQLVQFGLICLVGLPVVALLWGATLLAIGVCAVVGGLVALLAACCPRVVRPVFVGLCSLVLPIGLVVSEIVLLLIFFCVFLPMGLALRLARPDALDLNWRRHAVRTHWQPKERASNPARYYRQS